MEGESHGVLLFYFLLIEFHCTFSIYFKILTNYVYYSDSKDSLGQDVLRQEVISTASSDSA